MKWEEVKLDECLNLITYGFTNPMPDSDIGPWKVTAKDISDGKIDFTSARHTTFDAYQNDLTDKSRPIRDDILLTKDGTLGRLALVGDEQICINQSVALLRVNKEKLMPLYLKYLLETPEYQGKMMADAGGATIKHIYITRVNQLMIPVPPMSVQKNLANIIKTYDDLIENNQKQIKLLEEAAQRLYKEWFVDLRFPGYEDVEIADGLPKGWEWKKLGEVCETYGGGTPSTKEPSYYDNGNLLWVTPTDITRNSSLVLLDTEKKITEEGLKNSSAKMVPEESILMTSRASVGYFGVCEKSVCTNQGFISCVPNKECFQMYLLYNLLNRVEEIRQKAGGSTYLEISKKTFRDFDIILPDIEVLKEFQKLEHKILEETRSLSKKIVCLKEARDRLLPKLMSGEVEV